MTSTTNTSDYSDDIYNRRIFYRGQTLSVISENLNVREGAGTDYNILEKLTAGDEMTFLFEDGEWLFIQTANSEIQGFVYYRYVE